MTKLNLTLITSPDNWKGILHQLHKYIFVGLYVQFVWSVCSIKKTKKEKNCMGPFTNFPREAKVYNCYIASKNTRKTKYSIIYSGRIRYFISNKQ